MTLSSRVSRPPPSLPPPRPCSSSRVYLAVVPDARLHAAFRIISQIDTSVLSAAIDRCGGIGFNRPSARWVMKRGFCRDSALFETSDLRVPTWWKPACGNNARELARAGASLPVPRDMFDRDCVSEIGICRNRVGIVIFLLHLPRFHAISHEPLNFSR